LTPVSQHIIKAGIPFGLYSSSVNRELTTMSREHKNTKDFVVILLAWLLAISLVYLVVLKFKLLFH
jgi:hypothetical protein